MWKYISVYFIFLATCWATSSCQSIFMENDGISLNVTVETEKLHLNLKQGDVEKLTGELGIGINKSLVACEGLENCFEIGDSRLHVIADINSGFSIFWTTINTAIKFKDCFELASYNWYGGPERFVQEWPIEKLKLRNFANVPHESERAAIVEPYWLNSGGAYIFVNEKVPLFIDQNTVTSRGKVCFSAKSASPYSARDKVVLHYTVVATENARTGHLHAVQNFLGKPSGHPNYKIIKRPIWSTWARYKRDINDSVLLQFAQEIVENGYPDGQFEIDDDWEECYGALTFRKSKFSDIDNTLAKIKANNFTVSLWVHPFVNLDCSKYLNMGRKYDFFVKNVRGSDLTRWWNSFLWQATYLDFTKPEVQKWFVERLRKLQQQHGIDSFKFDAGETSWAPQVSVLNGDVDTMPSNLVSDYVRTCAKLGDLIEVRTGWRTQDLPVFVRMMDKDSHWGIDNGLYTLITTLLQMNLNGYTMVLPDMIGGNGYNGAPSAELFVRWVQANTFMPAIQFSYVPWDYNSTFDIKGITRTFVELHERYAPYIRAQMQRSIEEGYPVNAPIWWVAPDDEVAQKSDTEFLLGEDILVAPVIVEGARSRDIYLPLGIWIDGNYGQIHEGPISILNYSAPIEILPYFVRQGSKAEVYKLEIPGHV